MILHSLVYAACITTGIYFLIEYTKYCVKKSREIIKGINEETARLKEEGRQIDEDIKRIKQETKKVIEERKQIESENEINKIALGFIKKNGKKPNSI